MTKEGIWIIALMICMVIQEARMIKLWEKMKKVERKNIVLHEQNVKVFEEVYANFDILKKADDMLEEEFIDGIRKLVRLQESEERDNQCHQSDKGT